MTKLSLDPESRIDTAAGAARSLRRNQCSDEERKCMKPTIEIYASGPVSGSEAAALKRLVEALTELGKPALIFSNFTCNQRQVDFLIVTEFRVAHLELKHFPGPIEGEDFGPWYSLHASGARGPRIPSEEGNPREQAKNTKYAISDSLEEFARGTGAGPLRKGEKYFRRFESAVCLFPRIHPDSSLTRRDFKARVWSFENCLDEMDASSLVNPWPLDLWRRFATEYLHLDQVPLEAAISTEVYEAVTRLEALRANQVASLQTHVQETIELGPELPIGEHLLIIGQKGIGKTQLVTRFAHKIVSAGSLCLLLKCMRYRGDFAKLLHSAIAIAPYSSSSVGELVQTAETCHAPILLILDGIDQVNGRYREELLEASAAFFERHYSSVVIT